MKLEKRHYYIFFGILTIITRDVNSLWKRKKKVIWCSSKIHLHVLSSVKDRQCQKGKLNLFRKWADLKKGKGFHLKGGGVRQNASTLCNMLPRANPTPQKIHNIKLGGLQFWVLIPNLKFIQFLSWNKCLINVSKTEHLYSKKSNTNLLDIIKLYILVKTQGEITLWSHPGLVGITSSQLSSTVSKYNLCADSNLGRDHSFSTYEKFFRKTNIFYPLIRTQMCAYQGGKKC